jgi:ribonucleoside-triphosphate reductase
MKNIKYIVKRTGEKEGFNLKKIENAITKAFNSLGYSVSSELMSQIINEIDWWKDITVEDIQDQIEEILIRFDLSEVAKSFIIYRNKHKTLRDQAENKVKFIETFVKSDNTANATIDDNSNVGTKGIAVLNAEIHKEDNKNTNMYIWENWIKQLYPNFPIKQMRKDFETIMYPHDSSSQIMMPYCMAVSMYPFLLNGLKDLGGKSAVPKNIDSFCGIYVNLVFALASEVKGAVATPEFLMYMDYFCRKEWGDNYYQKSDVSITSEHCLRHKTIGNQIDQYFQQVTYSINQIAGSRGAQSPFTNFSFFDKYFFDGMFGGFYFPDGTKPQWESTNWLQQRYLHWLNQERLKCILTFPVCSYACLTENGEYKDKETFDFVTQEYSEGNSFFLYLSESVDSLSSCCRLQNSVQDNTFSFTNGMVGVMTGSKQVITLNLNRIIQDWNALFRRNFDIIDYDNLKSYFISILDRIYKYHTAYNQMLHWTKDHNLFNAYNAGFINLDKQYLTIGISGLNQAAEFLGFKCNNNSQYQEFCSFIFNTIKEQNILHKTKSENFNTEQVPAESAAIKLYNRDKKDGYWVPEDTNLYASYIFKPNDSDISIFDKITLHSSKFASDKLDGGSACHLNLEEHLSKTQYEKVLEYAAKVNCKYLTFNIPNSECEQCGYITKSPIKVCPKCGSTQITLWDRIIGYLTSIKNWSKGRQEEQKIRVYNKLEK